MSKGKKENTILLTIVSVATFVVALAGATFAYFTARVSGNDEASSVVVNTAQIGTITFETTNEIKLEDAYPGITSNELEFSVAADDKSTTNVKYALVWDQIDNQFVEQSDLVYTLSGSSNNEDSNGLVPNVNEVQVPNTKATIGVGSLSPKETHTYRLSVKFKETGSNQNANQGKSFTGKIQVTTGDDQETYYNDQNKEGTSEKPSAY